VRRAAVPVAVLLSLGGCRSVRPLDVDDLRHRRPQTLLVYNEENDAFLLNDDVGGYSPLGLLGGVAMVAGQARRGTKLRESSHAVDPTPRRAEALGGDFARANQLEIVHLEPEPAKDGVVYQRRPRGGADLLLELRTASWGLDVLPWTGLFDKSRCAVHLEVELKLTDLRDGAVLAERSCVGDDPLATDARRSRSLTRAQALTARLPTCDQLTAEEGLLMKAELARASVRCDDDFRENVLELEED
jgi:hypothetical protein